MSWKCSGLQAAILPASTFTDLNTFITDLNTFTNPHLRTHSYERIACSSTRILSASRTRTLYHPLSFGRGVSDGESRSRCRYPLLA